MDRPEPPPARLHPATRLAVYCKEYRRDGDCGCGPRRCDRTREIATWQQCLDCKSAELPA